MLVIRPPETGGIGNTTDARVESHSPDQEPGSNADTGGIDPSKMQKILRSPSSMKKKVMNKTFGVSLRELGRDANGVKVPDLIKKVTDFIQMHGIGHEGIFRVNGSSRVVDNLKNQYDRTGDADLENAEDVMAVASLLKLFLRELPEPVMTDYLHQSFIAVQEEYKMDRSECVKQLKNLILQLPEENYLLLQYIISFLVKVSKYEDTNKMSSQALAIVFGPNLFRCCEGLQGLREQGITNSVVRNLIDHYSTLFMEDEAEDDTRQVVGSTGSSSKRIQVQAATTERSPPVIKRRQMRKRADEEKDYNSNSYSDTDREEQRRSGLDPDDKSISDQSNHSTLSTGLLSPRDLLSTGSEERSYSPFNLDSDNGTSAAPSPVINDVSSELVEQTIKQSVTQHLFGQDGRSESPLDDAPVPSPRRRRQEKKKQRALQEARNNLENGKADILEDPNTSSPTPDIFQSSVQSRVQHFSDSGQLPGNRNNSGSSPENSPKTKRKLQSSSRAFELFESQGIVFAPKETQSRSSASSFIDSPNRLDESESSSVLKPRRKAPEAPIRPSKNGRPKSPGDNGSPASEGSPSGGSPRSKSPKPKSPKLSMRLLDERRAESPSESAMIGEDEYEENISDLASVKRNSPALKSLTSGRAPPPKNRRSPSRKNRLKRESDFSELTIDIEPIQIAQETPMEQSSPLPPPDVLPTDAQFTKELDHPHPQPQPKPRKKKSRSRSLSGGGSKTENYDADGVVMEDGYSTPPSKSPRRRSSDERQRYRDKQEQNGASENHRRHVPPLNLSNLHEHGDGAEPIPAWQGQTHLEPGPDEAVLSPRSSHKIQAAVNAFQYEEYMWYEAPLSPRAKNLPYSFSSISENTDLEIPPSPPSEQSFLTGYCPSKRAEKHGEEDISVTKHLTRQIRSLKRKIRQFEDEFEKDKGYKPSHIDKSTQPEIKKMMGELKRANKQLKEAKEMAAQANVPLHNTMPARAKRNLTDDLYGAESSHLDIMRDSLQQAQLRLEEKRRECNRLQDLNQMDRLQVQEEKTAIQKALLQLENRFGRPSTKETKELMKPLYDRYRNLKKLIAKFEIRRATEENFNPAQDLQTIDEYAETKEFKPKQLGDVHSKYRDDDEMGTTDFAVTQDLSLLKDAAPMMTGYDEGYPSPDGASGRRDSLGGSDSTSPALDMLATNLHEASVVELIASQNQAKDDKRRLRKVLKEFEDSFFQETGRRVQREDRTPMETEYNEYKHLKQQLKLLDALIAKHHGNFQTRTMATL